MYGSQSDEDKKHQRVVGFGMGVNYNDIFGVDGEINKSSFTSHDNSADEVLMLRAEISSLKSQLNAQTEEIKEMKAMNQQIKDEMKDQFTTVTSLLLSKFAGRHSSDIPARADSRERTHNFQVNQDSSSRDGKCSSRNRNAGRSSI